jgi:hypothetical protein
MLCERRMCKTNVLQQFEENYSKRPVTLSMPILPVPLSETRGHAQIILFFFVSFLQRHCIIAIVTVLRHIY